MKREVLLLVFGILFIIYIAGIVYASCVIPYNEMNINSDTTLCKGTYYLTKGVNVGSIFNNVLEGVTLDCNGSTIIGSDVDLGGGLPWYYSGIFVWNSKNITLKNCIITNYFYGVTFWYVFNSTVINITSEKNAWGSYLYLSDSNRILNSKFLETKYDAGIEIQNSGNNFIINNEFSNNSNNGIEIFSSSHNFINGNTFNYNRYGINLWDEGYNNITDNTFYSSDANPPIGSNYWFDNIWYIAGILVNSNNNNIFQNRFYGQGILEYPNLINNYCINCLGNSYYNDATGPTCPSSCDIKDQDNDGVPDTEDKCPDTIGKQIIYGCSCEQILAFKPGNNKGELKNNCSNGTMDVFSKQIGWTKNLFS